MTKINMAVKTESNKLTQADLQNIKEGLLLRRKVLLDNKIQLIQKPDHPHSTYSDVIDKASIEERFHIKLRTQILEQNLIRDIDIALKNIENGEFGYCMLCGCEIHKERIQAYPTATHCVECKTAVEMKKNYKTHGGVYEHQLIKK